MLKLCKESIQITKSNIKMLTFYLLKISLGNESSRDVAADIEMMYNFLAIKKPK